MKKNGEYVGVDEKYIPEEEKYVDNEANKEIKDSINDGLRSVKDYVTDEDNQKEIKKTCKKSLKFLKGVGIVYLIFICIIVLLVIGVFVAVFINMTKINNSADGIYEKAGSVIDKGIDKTEIKAFNASFELYSGTQSGFFVEKLLDEIVTNNKTEPNHIVTVVYNDITTTISDEIITLKQSLDNSKNYEVSLNYDKNGFVNKITVK